MRAEVSGDNAVLPPSIFRGTALFLFIAIFCNHACSECLTLDWSVSYDGPVSAGDIAHGLVTDASGNILVCGYEWAGAYPQRKNWAIRKYASNGDLAWSRTYNGPYGYDDEATAINVDASGNVMATGFEYYDGIFQYDNWMIRKYDEAGNLLWNRSYDGLGSSTDRAYSVATDASSNIIVAGFEAVSGQGYNCLVRKYDSSGNLLWSQSYNSPANNNDIAYGVAVDASGNVIVAGYEKRTDLGQAEDWLIRKYDSGGNLQWSRTYNSPANSIDIARSVSVDSTGNVYVAGYIKNSVISNDYNWLVLKYDTSGNLIWSRSYNSLGNGEGKAYSVAVDSSGGVYVAGYEDRSDIGQDWNWLIRKYDSNGNLHWSESYNDPADGWDIAEGVAVDGSGNVIVAGSEYRGDLGQSANWRIRKYRQIACPAVTEQPPAGPVAGEIWVSSTTGRLPVSPAANEQAVFILNLTKPGRIHVIVYSLLWEEVTVVFDGDAQAGPLELRWNGRNRKGQVIADGTYLVRFDIPGKKTAIKRVVIGK